jgi:hypothetical protein
MRRQPLNQFRIVLATHALLPGGVLPDGPSIVASRPRRLADPSFLSERGARPEDGCQSCDPVRLQHRRAGRQGGGALSESRPRLFCRARGLIHWAVDDAPPRWP